MVLINFEWFIGRAVTSEGRASWLAAFIRGTLVAVRADIGVKLGCSCRAGLVEMGACRLAAELLLTCR